MNEKIVANTTGLNQRGAFWYVRVVVPPTLRPSFGKSRYNVATGHTDKRQANVQAAGIRAEWLTKFAQKERELSPQPLPAVSPEMALELAQRVHASVLRNDDRLRSDLPLLAEMMHVRQELDRKAGDPSHVPQWVPPEARKDDLTGLRDGEAHDLTGLNDHLSKAAASAPSKRNLAAVLPLVQAEARALGLFFDHTAPGGRETLEASLKAYRAAHHEVTLRDSGEVVHTPVVFHAYRPYQGTDSAGCLPTLERLRGLCQDCGHCGGLWSCPGAVRGVRPRVNPKGHHEGTGG